MVFSIFIVIATISGISYANVIDPREDVTFMVPIGFILTFVPTVIAVFVSVFQKLLADAIVMKSENDLII